MGQQTRTRMLQIKRLTVAASATGRPRRGAPPREAAAIQDLSLDLHAGERVAMVGGPGAGKTSLIGALVSFPVATGGQVLLHGQDRPLDVVVASPRELREVRRTIALVPPGGVGVLDPRLRVGRALTHVQTDNGWAVAAARSRVPGLLQSLGLPAALAALRVSQLDPVQLFLVVLVRALALGPRLLLVDEPAPDGDALTRGVVASALRQAAVGRTLVVCSRHLDIPRLVCTRLVLLHRGRLMEDVGLANFLRRPLHPCGQEFLRAEQPAPAVPGVTGEESATSGCAYRLECRHASAICAQQVPLPARHRDGGLVACHHAAELTLRGQA